MIDDLTIRCDSNYTYYPLLLSGTGWKLKIQLEPVKQIIFEGTEAPSQAEIVYALSGSMLPVIMVPICQILIDHLLKAKSIDQL